MRAADFSTHIIGRVKSFAICVAITRDDLHAQKKLQTFLNGVFIKFGCCFRMILLKINIIKTRAGSFIVERYIYVIHKLTD